MWSLSQSTEPPLSPEGHLALGSWVQPFGWENFAWPLSHRHILRSPWTPSSIVTHQPEKHCQLSTLGTSPQSQRIGPALFLGCNGNASGAIQTSKWRVLLSNLPIWGTSSHSTRSHFPAEGHLQFWISSQVPAWAYLHVLLSKPSIPRPSWTRIPA